MTSERVEWEAGGGEPRTPTGYKSFVPIPPIGRCAANRGLPTRNPYGVGKRS